MKHAGMSFERALNKNNVEYEKTSKARFLIRFIKRNENAKITIF